MLDWKRLKSGRPPFSNHLDDGSYGCPVCASEWPSEIAYEQHYRSGHGFPPQRQDLASRAWRYFTDNGTESNRPLSPPLWTKAVRASAGLADTQGAPITTADPKSNDRLLKSANPWAYFSFYGGLFILAASAVELINGEFVQAAIFVSLGVALLLMAADQRSM